MVSQIRMFRQSKILPLNVLQKQDIIFISKNFIINFNQFAILLKELFYDHILLLLPPFELN